MPKPLDLKNFLQKARQAHGLAYDYSKVNFVNTHTKVEIICRTHGSFFQEPRAHFKYGCRRCAAKKRGEKLAKTYRSSKSDFVAKARSIHGNKYSYELVKYVNNRAKVTIICKKHGSFLQTPNNHFSGNGGCPSCRGNAISEGVRKNIEHFIRKSTERHGNRYDYSKSIYSGAQHAILIRCKEHGMFSQVANDHMNGAGCSDCKAKKASIELSYTNEEFVERSNLIHNFKYGYSKIKYQNSRTLVTIVCPEHGDFSQIAGLHLSGRGCQKCSKLALIKKATKTTEKFVENAKQVHGERYDYSLVEYKSAKTAVTIICPSHGPFNQIPNGHLSGNGCQICADQNKGFDGLAVFLSDNKHAEKPCELYIAKFFGFIKIGIAHNSIKRENRYHLLFTQKLRRVEAWLIEQRLLTLTLSHRPKRLPLRLRDWAGRYELRNAQAISVAQLKMIITSDLKFIKKFGWRKYAEHHRIGLMGFGWMGEKYFE